MQISSHFRIIGIFPYVCWLPVYLWIFGESQRHEFVAGIFTDIFAVLLGIVRWTGKEIERWVFAFFLFLDCDTYLL